MWHLEDALSNLTDLLSSYMKVPLAKAGILGFVVDGHFVLETLLVVIILVLMTQKSYKPDKGGLTEKEVTQLCEEWDPEPLHPHLEVDVLNHSPPVLESEAGPRTVVAGKDVLNLTSTSFLGLTSSPRVKEAAMDALNKYGVGSCGPRGFYGTIDVHLDLEEKIAKFMGVDDCILYSYGLATPSSTIPAFCKRGDLIIADEGLHWGVQNGLQLSRSTVRYFRHNDMEALEARLLQVKAEDRRERHPLNRRFIVVEGIYQNSGLLAPIDKIVELRDKYKFRILVDESLSFGVLGKTGRGVSEHFGVPVAKLDIIVAGMAHSLASVGGFCCGAARMVDHQRLSGLGYCFSASLPPFLASAAMASLGEIEEHPELRQHLNANVVAFRRAVANIPGLRVGGDPISPVLFLHLRHSRGSFASDSKVLQQIADQLLNKEGVLASVPKRSPIDSCSLPAGIRMVLSARHVAKELLAAAESLRKVTRDVLGQAEDE